MLDYRPANLEFDVATIGIVPDSLGEYKNADEAIEFMHKNLVGLNQRVTVNRFMDNFEKTELRKEYQEMLEIKLPLLEKDLMKATATYNEAKKELTKAQQMVSATTSEVITIANTVKLGVKEITLDDQFTWRCAFEGKYYFFTFIDKSIKLVKTSDIPESEKLELYNAMLKNEEFFHTNFGSGYKGKKEEGQPKVKFTKTGKGDGSAESPLQFDVEVAETSDTPDPNK